MRLLVLLRFLFLACVFFPTNVALAAECNDVHQAILRLGANTAVQPPAAVVQAGGTITLRWSRGEARDRHPAYLMIAFDAPVRFEGTNFYALSPGAAGPFSIRQFGEQTRTVVPYYGYGMPRNGAITVRPLQAGTLGVRWAVVGHDGCTEQVAQGGSGKATVQVQAAGTPEIVFSDGLAGEEPKQRIFSPAGRRIIEIFDGRYRLIDEAGRAEIAERPGEEPRFSPTGRFLAARVEDGIEILDTVDGKVVYKDPVSRVIAWDNADSFAVAGRGQWGSVAVLAPLLGEPTIMDVSAGCHACSGTDSVALRVDLENNVAVYKAEGAGGASLTSKVKVDPRSSDNTFSDTDDKVIAFVKRHSPATTFTLPKRWEMRGGLRFSHVWPSRPGETPSDPQVKLRRFLVPPLLHPVQVAAPAERPEAAKVVQWRSARGNEAAAGRTILTRLLDFGLPVPEAAIEPSKAVFKRELVIDNEATSIVDGDSTKISMSRIARRIEREIPAAKGVFVGEVKDGGICRPDDGSGNRQDQVYEKFDRAFRFQSGKRTIWVTHFLCREGSGAFGYPSYMLFDSASSSPWFLHRATEKEDGAPADACSSTVSICTTDAQIAGDRFLILSSKESRAVEIFDLTTRKRIFRKYALLRGDLLAKVLLSDDARIAMQINTDDSFAIFRIEGAELLFQGRYVDDEVALWTPEGHFDATPEGAHY